jgi:uncharacterized protein (TIGR02001 family)
VHAQLGATVGVDSDYRFRGISLSDSHPALRASLDYDATNGWYAGATGAASLQQRYRVLLGYLGYAQRGVQGVGWELGVTGLHAVGAARYDSVEAYAGLLGEHWNLRVHYSPDDFGSGLQTAYTEFDVSAPIQPGLRWLAHAGVLRIVGGHPSDGVQAWRGDWRLGIGVALDPFDLQFAWVGAGRGGPPIHGARGGRWVLSATFAF